MGEVYKAKNTRLDRTVAIKVLPAALAADPDFKARFEREAKSISALNHPNICTLFDVGSTPSTGSAGSPQASSLRLRSLRLRSWQATNVARPRRMVSRVSQEAPKQAPLGRLCESGWSAADAGSGLYRSGVVQPRDHCRRGFKRGGEPRPHTPAGVEPLSGPRPIRQPLRSYVDASAARAPHCLGRRALRARRLQAFGCRRVR